MTSLEHNFRISGPFYLTSIIDWTNPYHRKSVAASLVNGAYILEHDRQQYREHTPQALAPPWWESFGFRLHKKLEDERDGSYFGAIYEYLNWRSDYDYPGQPPRYVISFRGTIKGMANLRDLKVDFQLILNRLHQSSRFQNGLGIARDLVRNNEPDNVWLAGHSKGSAIALLVGRILFMEKSNLQTYLFNPPFPSLPVEHIANKMVRNIVRWGKSTVTVTLVRGLAILGPKTIYKEQMAIFSDWIPHMFVNQSDPICCGYIPYFEASSSGTVDIEKHAAQHSIIARIAGQDSAPLHVLPSANLTIHLIRRERFNQSHSINQWWRPDINCTSELHRFL